MERPDEMARKEGSRKRATKKVATRGRSTTSSTTAKRARPPKNVLIEGSDSETEHALLTKPEQQQLLTYLLKGASPMAVCEKLGIPRASFLRTFTEEERFRDDYYAAMTLLSQNVLMALYRQALEGNVSAQTNWLKAMPPPGWNGEPEARTIPLFSFDETLDDLSDDELLNLARAMEIEMPTAIAKGGP